MFRLSEIRVVVCLTAILFLLSYEIQGQPSFENVSAELGVTKSYSAFPMYGAGLSVRDYDQDGWDDITMCTSVIDHVVFYKNYFGTFKEEDIGLPTLSQDKYSVWVDYNNDGFLDLFTVSQSAGVVLMKGDSTFNYQNVTAPSGLSGLNYVFREGALFFDMNNDGLLDLYLGAYDFQNTNRLFIQDSNHSFNDISAMSGTCDSLKATFHAVAIDYNEDGLMDFYVANDFSGGNALYRNNGDSTFTDVATQTGMYQTLDAMGLGVGDFDGDLDLDIHITDRFNQSRLLRNNGNATYTEVGVEHGVDYENGFGWGNSFFDADLDGDEDLYVSGIKIPFAQGLPSYLYINDGTGYFESEIIGNDSLYSFSNAIFDFNNDLLPDICALNSDNNPTSVWKNTTNTSALRFSVKLKGCSSNLDGFGSRMIAYDGNDARLYSFHSSQSFLSQNSDRKIVPILNGPHLDSLKIFWPSGEITLIENIAPDQTILVEECGVVSPYPVITVGDYADHELTLCPGDTITLGVDGQYSSYEWSTGDVSNSINVTSSGVYDVTVYNQFGISSSSTRNITIQAYNTPDYNLIIEHPACFDNGLIAFQSNGQETYQYEWSNGSEEDSINGLTPGTYEITISNDGFCGVTETIELIGPDSLVPITVTAQKTNALCYASKDGVIELNVEGGTPPYTYDWSSGLTGSTVNVGAGAHDVTIVDSLNCSKDTSFVIQQPQLLFVWPETTADTNMTGVGKAWVEVNGGVPPYTILWNDSLQQTGDTAYMLKADDYEVQVTDINGCDTIVTTKVRNREVLGLDKTVGFPSIDCKSSGSQLLLQMDADESLDNIALYDLTGRSVPFKAERSSRNRVLLSIEGRGIFILHRDGLPACKVLLF